MFAAIEIIPIIPFDEGFFAGKAMGRDAVRRQSSELLAGVYLKDTLGAMERADLGRYVMARLETEPNYARYPELEDLYPEQVDYLRGFARGSGCSLTETGIYSYLIFRAEIDREYAQFQQYVTPTVGHCSGFVMVGPDGVIGGQNIDSAPPAKPEGYRFHAPGPYCGFVQRKTKFSPAPFRRPRTGYIEDAGIGNELGIAYLGGGSCGVLLDEPIEDTWPIGRVPLLRFATDIHHLAELYRRYTLHNWNRNSQTFADIHGNAMVVEKSFRRVGIRMKRPEDPAIWATEGYWETEEMGGYLRAKRLEYLEKTGKHAGASDMQYAADNGVRFTHIAALCHENWGRGYEHVRRILTDHSPFPRDICRHAGPNTDAYDVTVTLKSYFQDVTHNRVFTRDWIPWRKFACQVPETVLQYAPRV